MTTQKSPLTCAEEEALEKQAGLTTSPERSQRLRAASDLAVQEELARAIKHLRESERGKAALYNLERFLQQGGAGLDRGNQEEVAFIIQCAFHCPWNLPGGYKLQPTPTKGNQ